jgi:hypothetical protein
MQFLPELELINRLCIARVKYHRSSGAIKPNWTSIKLAIKNKTSRND